MKKIVFTEEFCQPQNLFPFTLTRQIQDIRIGISTIREKWEAWLGMPSFDKYEEDYKDLDRAVLINQDIGNDIFYLVHGNVLPTVKLVKQVKKMKPGECISLPEKECIVYCISKREILTENRIRMTKAIEVQEELKEISFPWEINEMNEWALQQDFERLSLGRKSQKVPATNRISGTRIFIEKGARVENCFLNCEDGPIYIGRNAIVMDGAMIRGPVSIGDGAVVKMGAKIYGATTIGPKCTVGGEIKNAVLFGHSNKAHDGYIGDSVIGEWCNLGAGTTNSNIKNNASQVVVWTPAGPRNAGLKCGVMMGDYSRTAINTSINTGTVIGVSCNVFGTGLTPKYIPNFSWGNEGIERYEFQKACLDIQSWKSLKNAALTESEKTILKHIFEHY